MLRNTPKAVLILMVVMLLVSLEAIGALAAAFFPAVPAVFSASKYPAPYPQPTDNAYPPYPQPTDDAYPTYPPYPGPTSTYPPPSPSPGSPPPGRSRARHTASISVVLRPNRSISEARGVIGYTIVVMNHGRGEAQNVVITLPFDPTRAQVLDATFSQASAWVSKLEQGSIEIQTGQIDAGGDVLTATVRLLVLASTPGDANLIGRASFRWSGSGGHGEGRSNWTPQIARGDPDAQLLQTLAVRPASGPAGVEHTFSADIFGPGEPVSLWYNTPTGEDIAVGTTTVDADGIVQLRFRTDRLARGTYSMVAHGSWTDFTAVGQFRVE